MALWLGENDVVAEVLRVGRNRCQQVPLGPEWGLWMISQSSEIAPASERNRLEAAHHATAVPRSTGYAGAANSDQGKGSPSDG
jgi:hypothetical protein